MPLPAPPSLPLTDVALFLDLDGTLFPLQARPELVWGDAESSALLADLQRALNGRLAVLTGRSLRDADRILSGEVLAVSGSHGLERRDAQGLAHVAPVHPALDEARAAFAAFQAAHTELVLEDKGLGVCLHYRTAPGLEAEVLELGRDLAARLPLTAQPGSMMFELRTPGGGKGEALRAYLAEPPFTGALPVFVGDDLTDEHGFEAAAALGGYGVIVGDRRPTAARFALADVSAVRRWLARSAAGTVAA
ncbi:MAG: trehalose-phosphatase [Proteobacteria bacterium]|nr:trehalose-phosphatase [Pseudomonadota bacterium]